MDRNTAAGELTRASAGALAFSVAAPGDDAEVRALLRASVTAGRVRLAFTREPDYALGQGLGGAVDHTIVARNRGRLVALGRCSTRTLYRNGEPSRIGYLSELRVLPDVTLGAKVLRDGYAFLRDVLSDNDAHCYVTSIASDNVRARAVLERGGRLGVPPYTHIADLATLLVHAPGVRCDDTAIRQSPGIIDRDELSAFLDGAARRAQLAPTWDDARWSALARHGITPQHFHTLRDHRGIHAAAALWDQRRFRQTVVDGYGGSLRTSRPLVNLVERVRGRPALPVPGQPLVQASVLGASVRDVTSWHPLWTLLRTRAAAAGIPWLLLTRDARDPELPTLESMLAPRLYATRLYDVAWQRGSTGTAAWDGRLFCPEAGLL